MVAAVLSQTNIITSDDLSRIRARVPGCELVLMADISAGTVLAWNGALKFPQEHLDAICAQAREVFVIGGDYVADWAVLALPTGLRVFVRLPQEPFEAVCAVLPSGGDAEAAISVLRGALEQGSPATPGQRPER